MKARLFVVFSALLLILTYGISTSQELPGRIENKIIYNSSNTQDPNDVSSLPETRIPTSRETELMDEIRSIKETDDQNQNSRLQELESQLDALNPQSVRAPGIYIGGEIGQANVKNPPFMQDIIGNVEIRNTGTSLVTGIATATEQRGSTEGRIWVALAWQSTSAADTIRLYYSDTDGMTWVYYGWGKLGGTDRINRDQMDMEIIENTSGDKYVWITYGYREGAGTGRWRTGGVIFRTPTFGGGFFAMSWPGDNSTKRYYRLRITSDNAQYAGIPYVYMVASFDSTTGSGHYNTQKTARVTSPFSTTPTISYKADKFFWNTNVADGNVRDLHSDIAYFRHSTDSIIVSYSNMRDSTKIFFAKSNISNGTASSTGAGGFIGGSNSTHHKQYGCLTTNGIDNGSVFCFFRQNTTTWRISYYRTTNWGNFNSMSQAALQGSITSNSNQVDAVGVRGSTRHYFTWRLDGSPDSIKYVATLNTGTWPRNVGRMNSQSVTSGVLGPHAGFRYTPNDSCFVVYSPTGPYDVWAAYGCSGLITNVKGTETPVQYALHQNYPNPFNPVTSIKFDIPKDAFVKLAVYDVLGREVSTLVNEVKAAGSYQVDFNASGLTSGIYFYKLTSGSFTEIKKMMLLK